MTKDIFIQNDIIIPESELEFTTSRSGGPGGQHVNKTSSKVTIRWNIKNSNSLNDVQKEIVLQNLASQLTSDGDLIINSSSTRSQLQNKQLAIKHLILIIQKALYVPKKRTKTKIPKIIKEKILEKKSYRGKIKKLRNKKFDFD